MAQLEMGRSDFAQDTTSLQGQTDPRARGIVHVPLARPVARRVRYYGPVGDKASEGPQLADPTETRHLHPDKPLRWDVRLKPDLRGDDSPVFHRDHPIGDVSDADVMGDHQDRAAFLASQSHQDLNHLTPGLAIEGRRRLVGEHQFRAAGESPRDRNPLLLSAREMGGISVRPAARDQLESSISAGAAPPLLSLVSSGWS